MINCIGYFVLDNGATHVLVAKTVHLADYVYFDLNACKISCKRGNLRWYYYAIVKFACS